MNALFAALAAAGTAVLLVSAYLLLLALASRRPRAPAATPCAIRFDLIVPAHDEEAGIARTVRSLVAVDYPEALRRVIVVADNCTDRTAQRASDAGAFVLVRTDPCRRGKGYALSAAFDHSVAAGFADAVVVVDADTVVSPNLLRAFAARLDGGARAAQAGSAVLNAGDSWRTELMQLAFALFNGVRSLSRDNLGLSVGLRGNGMCLSTRLLRDHPYRAFSLVEDVEYGIALGRAGVRVRYAHEATVASAMVSSGASAAAQRRRWELGRARLARAVAPSLLLEAFGSRSVLLLDLAIDLIVPPLSFIAITIAAGAAAATALRAPASWLWGVSAACLAVYVARGWQIAGLGVRGARALLWAPFYVAWKTAVLARRSTGHWVRTAREEAPA
jgi:1,2-diacylglycerol 3-beta-glucosyltransferase